MPSSWKSFSLGMCILILLATLHLTPENVAEGRAERTGAPAEVQTTAMNRPAEFIVSPVVTNANVSAFTATMGDGPINTLISGGAFEPMVFRTRFQARGDSPNQIILNQTEADGWDSFREGYWDGASVRVYRVVNGQVVHVRTDSVSAGGHRASGWNNSTAGGQLVAPGTTHYEYRFDDWERPEVPYYFMVRAVDSNGNESTASNWVSVVNHSLTGPVTNTLISFTAPQIPGETVPPPAPAGLTYTTNPSNVVFNWTGVSAGDLAGYRLYRSDYLPATQRGFGIDLSVTPTDPGQYIRTGDLVFLDLKRYNWSRIQFVSNRVWAHYPVSGLPALTPFYADETPGGNWTFEPYSGATLVAEAGETNLHIQIPDDGETHSIFQYNHAGTWQNWYPVLEVGRTYTVEVWLRQQGMASPSVNFELRSFYGSQIAPVTFNVDGTWRKYTTTFTPQELWESEGGIGTMGLYFRGPGDLWVDNFRIYAAGTAFMDFPQAEYDALAASGLSALRTHGIVKTGFGYTGEALVNPPGVTTLRGNSDALNHNLPSLLRVMRKAGVNPWLQIEMFMSREEWLGIFEYLAAPYNPAVDTPQSKPWAYKRYQQGQTAPWLNEFDKVYFELSNETWNPMFAPWGFSGTNMPDAVTGQTYGDGRLYGLFQEYVRSIFLASPYWSPILEDKVDWVIGGWAAQSDANGYGQQAAAASPHSEWMTLAAYNGGWDEGAPPATLNDEGFFKALTYAPQAGIPRAYQFVETLQTQKQAGLANYRLGTYEAGPGYSLPGTISEAQSESESRVMKSLAAGTATLDIFLAQANMGYGIQNFFTFGRGRDGWTSHARVANGGQAYPSWKALSLYNLHGTGDFLVTHTQSVPTADLPASGERPALDSAAMASAYATRNGNRYSVFVLSRKLDNYPIAGDDGYTPVTLHLPFQNPTAITLYKLSGDPRAHNLDSDAVQLVTQTISTGAFSQDFVLNATTGADARGLPPASVFLYVFENTTTPPLPLTPILSVEQAAAQADPSVNPVFNFSAIFSEPVTGFAANDVVLGGTAGADTVEVKPLPGAQNMAYTILVSGMKNGGTVTVSVPAGAAQALSDGASSQVSTSRDNRVTFALPSEGAQLVFSVVEDSGIYSGDPNSQHEGENNVWVRDLGSDAIIALYLKFKPAWFSNHPITSATLRMHITNANAGNAFLYEISDDWRAATLTFNNSPRPTRRLSSVPVPDNPYRWQTFDVTDYVRRELGRDRTVSLALLADTYTSWQTSESDARPELIVQYGLASANDLVILTPQPFQAFHMGQAANITLRSAGGSGVVTWTQLDAANRPLPPGLNLATTGMIHGTPTQAGTWPVQVQASDGIRTTSLDLDWVVANYPAGAQQMVLGGTGATVYTQTLDHVWAIKGAPQDADVTPTEPDQPHMDEHLWTNEAGRTAYYQYNLSAVQGEIISATWRVYYDNLSYGYAMLHRTGDVYSGTTLPWTEAGLTYNNAPPIGAVIQTQNMDSAAGKWWEWNVTDYLRADMAQNRLFSLALTTEADLPFWATQDVQRGLRPVLVVVYRPRSYFLPLARR